MSVNTIQLKARIRAMTLALTTTVKIISLCFIVLISNTLIAHVDQPNELRRQNHTEAAMHVGLLLITVISITGFLHLSYQRKETQIKMQQYEDLINSLQSDIQKLLNEESINPVKLVISKSLNQHLNNPLSSRELDVLCQLGKGKSNKEISEVLFVSINTIRSHLHRIYDKLDVKNRTQAIRKIGEIQLIKA